MLPTMLTMDYTSTAVSKPQLNVSLYNSCYSPGVSYISILKIYAFPYNLDNYWYTHRDTGEYI